MVHVPKDYCTKSQYRWNPDTITLNTNESDYKLDGWMDHQMYLNCDTSGFRVLQVHNCLAEKQFLILILAASLLLAIYLFMSICGFFLNTLLS